MKVDRDRRHHVVSISGGKDSTATALLALDRASRAGESCSFLFADTGHEHEITYQYLEYLQARLGIEIEVVRADFSRDLERKQRVIRSKWVDEGVVTAQEADRIAELLRPTGIPFLDLSLWKGRFPSTKARFCSEFLKHHPLNSRILEIKREHPRLWSWQGVRADESLARARLRGFERGDFYTILRPILRWSAGEVFDLHAQRGVDPNPLYKQGMSRVGCMPCIHARKSEIRQIATRFPAEVERVAEWERMVSRVAKQDIELGRAIRTFFHTRTNPMVKTNRIEEISLERHGIRAVAEWSKTARGGRQVDLIAASEDVSMCSSAYGLCE